jgi:hypothetical protein
MKKSIHLEAGIKAAKFLFMPTVALLLLLFFWFFNVTKFVAFVTSENTGAAIFRIIAFLAEIILWCTFFEKYVKELKSEERFKAIKKNDFEWKVARNNSNFNDVLISDIRQAFNGDPYKQGSIHVAQIDDRCLIIKREASITN